MTRECGFTLHDKHVAANGAVRADDSLAAEDGGTGINGHVIFNGRMPFGAGELLAAEAERAPSVTPW